MQTPIARQVGAEFPIFAFSHCRDVVAAVTQAGGVGVLGALGMTPAQLDMELNWVEERIGNLPYGVDIVIPATSLDKDNDDPDVQAKLEALIPEGHRQFIEDLLQRHGVGPLPGEMRDGESLGNSAAALELVDVVLSHRAKLLVNALGPMPAAVCDRVHDVGMLAGGLVGKPAHAALQVANGVDIVIAQGSEAAGHTGAISTMVLVPQVVDAAGSVPVLAAGGIACGRQVAAALALGAQGAWTGTVWMTVDEADSGVVLKKRLLQATSTDTTQTKSFTGKPNRYLRSDWTDAWAAPGAPEPLPWPLQLKLTMPAFARIVHAQNEQLITTSIGQAIGMINAPQSSRQVLLEMVEEFTEAAGRLADLLAIAE